MTQTVDPHVQMSPEITRYYIYVVKLIAMYNVQLRNHETTVYSSIVHICIYIHYLRLQIGILTPL